MSVLSSIYSILSGRAPPFASDDSSHPNRDYSTYQDHLIGGGDGVTLPLAELESTLTNCASSLVVFDGRESSLGMRIKWYCTLMGWVRESHNSLSVAVNKVRWKRFLCPGI